MLTDVPAEPPRALAAAGKHNARSITAAAKRIDLTNAKDRGAIPRNSAKWQTDAWNFYDLLPEVKFAGRFLGSALSRLLLYPGIRVQPDEPPAALRDVLAMQTAALLADEPADEATFAAPGLTEAMVTAAEDDLAALANRRTGQGGLLRAWGVCLTISGDSWLVGTAEKDPAGEPTGEDEWQVLSDMNLERRGNTVTVRLAPGATPEPLAEEATLIRVWRPHEAWPALADSNMRAALDVCDEILIHARQFRSVAKSRNNAGVLLIPSELDFTAQVPTDPATGLPLSPTNADGLTELEEGMIKSMVTPVEDDGSASAVVPHFLRGPSTHLKEVRHIALDRKIDEQATARLNHLITRLAQGLDVPVEVLLGVADINHWGAWQVEDSTYRAHVQPLAELPAWAIGTAYLRPNLREHPAWNTEAGLAILDSVLVGVDPSQLVARPNRGQDAKDAHKAMVLSDAGLRKYLAFSDADAPTDEELLRRYALERGVGEQSITREVLRAVVDEAEDIIDEPTDQGFGTGGGGSNGGSPAGGDQPIPQDDVDDPVAAALGARVAAGLSSRLLDRMAMVAAAQGNPGARLAAIDQRLLARLQEAASAALEDALRTAGSRLRAKIRKDADVIRASIVGQPAQQVGPILAAAGQLTQDEEDEALAGAFGGLAVKWDEMVSQAQDDTEAVLRSASTTDTEQVDATMGDYRSSTDEDRHAGWAVLAAALLALARRRIRGMEDDDTGGEIDTTVSVQAGPVREALARAGGSVEPGRPPTQIAGALDPGAAGGVATGPRALGTLIRLGLAVVGWEWQVGAPSRPFEPHHALNGVRFATFDDPALANVAGVWPGFGHFWPSDHRGCVCSAQPTIVEVSARQPAEIVSA